MLDPALFREADRQLTICNACRYCEGLCPVFPALERRNTFLEGDVLYLANLCHDCRACMPACPFTEPHEFAIDIPTVMAEVRRETYAAYAFPRVFGEAFLRRSRPVAIFTLVSVVIAILLVWAGRPDDLFTTELGPGAFYRFVPWLAMLIPATVATAYGFLVMTLGLVRFWQDTDGPLRSRFDPLAFLSATADVLVLRQMRGGGPGCSYPEEAPSHGRVILHQLVFYGFLLTFAATVVAAYYQEILGVLPPYDLLSLPVVLGTVGGVGQVVGCGGLLALKVRGADQPATHVLRSMDVAFLVLLLLANLTGLALLAARETSWMGVLLAIHLGVLAGLFVAFPYSKFVHVIYRYAALVRNRQEERREAAAAAT